MSAFYKPDLEIELDSPFVRDEEDKLIRRSYWLDKSDRSLVMIMKNGIGAKLTNEEKRAHLLDLNKAELIEDVCIQEVLPPEEC
ncbi:MAG: hypothetical protein VX879_06865 [Pseudomonadota bacterium]|jgi:hypothetical protein|nr:hypothetical protein [Rhodospirillaceae bacterium]MCH2629087.1 hypothetical protein [Nisaea sp.]MEC7806052.1 hypothetical protein [Pseudomonadota bacterium]MEC7972370.1 hypothetical protein [Pseudomonadota bacterium]MEC9045412.1 hypothetical protein [Pseudomonadota bacterium]|tara:strand:- start:49 stop:300 length:252 start_codon:yes stop_codon:yes gene_type:complete